MSIQIPDLFIGFMQSKEGNDKSHALNPLEAIKYYNPPNGVKVLEVRISKNKSYFFFQLKID